MTAMMSAAASANVAESMTHHATAIAAMSPTADAHAQFANAAADLARRALDYLVGFTLSPVLWRKLPGARSAGRVQSVALRIVVDREMEIEAFRAREFWTVTAMLQTPRGQEFAARLTILGGKKLDKRALLITAAKLGFVFLLALAALLWLTFALARHLGMDLNLP